MQLHLALHFLLGELVLLRLLIDDLTGELVAVCSIDKLVALAEAALHTKDYTLPNTLPML